MPRPNRISSYACPVIDARVFYTDGYRTPDRANKPGCTMFRRDVLMDVRLPHSERPPEAVYEKPFPRPAKAGAKPASHARWRPFAAIAVAILAALFLWRILAPGQTHAPKQPPAPVRVATAQTRNIVVQERTVGTIIANATVQVTAQVGGQLVATHFKEGDLVRKGDLLFELDPRPFQAALAQANAMTARDQASLTSAHNDAIRYAALAQQGAASKSQADQFVAQANALAATVAADKANVQTARLNLIYSQIHSPVDGKTGPILVQQGNIIAANGTNPLVTITQIHPVKVSFFLPQSDLPRIQERMAAHNMTATIRTRGQGGEARTAPVDFVSNAVSNQTGTIELRATFPNLDNVLVPGQLADVSVSLGQLNNAIVVPHDAINLGPNSSYVWIVDSKSSAQMTNVTVLNDDGTTAAISGPVKSGDRVITDGALRVVQGGKVSVKQGRTSQSAHRTGQAPAGAQ
ncbi:MAG TPA: efflux RND transporter periplasmic adaptor subunit [Rhizomicrobium sp.]|jgi:multidrug efflux system membrane fusion protein|nr:efflux RND transporter periplasmic adaptor subunit [Rhizomicrobium sp.]